MQVFRRQLRAALDKLNPVCGAVVSSRGEILAQEGDFDRFPGRGLVKRLIGTPAAGQRTYEALAASEYLLFRDGLAIALAKRVAHETMVVVFALAVASEGHEFECLKAIHAAIVRNFDPTLHPEFLDAALPDAADPSPIAVTAMHPPEDGESLPLDLGELVLRRVAFEDRKDLAEIYSNPEVVRWEYRAPLDEVHVAIYAQSQEHVHFGNPLVPFGLAAVLKAEDKLIGDCRLVVDSLEDRQGEIGFAFNPRYTGRGWATKAIRATIGLAFARLKLHRITATTYGHNERARRLLERVGMRQEACHRQTKLVGEQWIDVLVYAVLEDEWPAID